MKYVSEILEAAIAEIEDGEVVDAIRRFLVTPKCVMRNWDYEDDTRFPCWIVASDPASNTAIAYCELGFGPASPWGLLNQNSEFNEMGPDAAWYSRLEDAFRQSMMWDGEDPEDYEVH